MTLMVGKYSSFPSPGSSLIHVTMHLVPKMHDNRWRTGDFEGYYVRDSRVLSV